MPEKLEGNQCAHRVLRAIGLLEGHVIDGVRLKAVAEQLGTNASTALRDLQTLAAAGFAERIPGREECWRLTPRIITIARRTAEEFALHREAIASFERCYSQQS